MINRLAESAPPPAELAAWVEVLFYLAGGTAAVIAAWYYLTGRDGERRITPQPLVVTPETQFATRAELEEVKRSVAALAAKIEHGFAELDLKRTTSLERLHGDLQAPPRDRGVRGAARAEGEAGGGKAERLKAEGGRWIGAGRRHRGHGGIPEGTEDGGF
jgi:hypothetical protein